MLRFLEGFRVSSGARRFLWSIAKFFLFRLGPESAHRLMVVTMKVGISLGMARLRVAGGAASNIAEAVPREILGMTFLSRVGLAAGFDKDAEILEGLPGLGFGFAEIGTVTPLPQNGNDRPRLFREPARRAIFNRMGFNGLGAQVVSERLRDARLSLPEGFRVGVNIGKNKDTPLDEAARDYILAARPFNGLADYLVINVSSPDTPGLRSLQTVEALKPIVGGVQEIIGRWRMTPPLLLKVAPELKEGILGDLIRGVEAHGIDGWVLTNTLSGKIELGGMEYSGGWSGSKLSIEARDRLREARSATRKPIISVGGIMDTQEARLRIELGADLIQIYTGWIYGGPSFPAELARAIS